MTDIADAPLTGETLKALEKLKDRMERRISLIAHPVHQIRETGWEYREKRGSFDRWTKIQGGLDSWECTFWPLGAREAGDEELIHAKFGWWCGDSYETLHVEFPLSYLDLTDGEIARLEVAKVDAAREKYEARNAIAAQKAEEARLHALGTKRQEVITKCMATIPGFDLLGPEQQEAIINAAVGA